MMQAWHQRVHTLLHVEESETAKTFALIRNFHIPGSTYWAVPEIRDIP